MEKVHIFFDKDGFVDGYVKGGMEENEHCIGYLLPKDDPFFENFNRYKIENGVLIYDESKVLELQKKRKIYQIEQEKEEDNKELLETMLLFQLGFITETEYEGEILTQKEFEKIVKKSVKNKENKKVKKKEKKEKIKKCKTLEELKQIDISQN